MVVWSGVMVNVKVIDNDQVGYEDILYKFVNIYNYTERVFQIFVILSLGLKRLELETPC